MDNSQITLEQFGAKIKQKYPVYSGYSDKEIGEKMLAKYPTYQSQIRQATPMPILTNEKGGFGTAVKDIVVGAGKDFIETSRGTADLLQSAGKAVLGAFGANTSKMGLKSIDNRTPEGAQIQEQLNSKSRGEQTGKVISTLAQLGAGFATKEAQLAVTKTKQGIDAYKAAKETKALGKSTAKITEMISPKPTVTQAKLAQSQGRLVEGKAPTFFKSGTEGSILPTQKTLNASELIVKRIPNASKLSSTELYKAVDTEITTTARTLKPQMQATPIKSETVQKINDNWENLKRTQLELADASQEANVLKIQQQFEARLMKSGSKSYDDLWETRKAYDDSIPENVKRANQISDESLQNKKEIWLQNRQVLNTAMDDVAGPAFKDMSDLYEARTGLLSKAKVDKAQLSKLREFTKNNPEISTILKGILGIKAFEKITGVNLPL